MATQKFGGDWTEEKLARIEKYLRAYTTILSKYDFKFAYIDAFAGTGYRSLRGENQETVQAESLFPELTDSEYKLFADGSARIALRVSPRFDKYIFVEKDPAKALELEILKEEFPEKSKDIDIINADANDALNKILKANWNSHRAVLFLDPFGMQIPWKTIELIAQTKAIDLWYLFPIGVAINRLLKRDGKINDSIIRKLNTTFGSEDWFDVFYKVNQDANLFGEIEIEKKANFKIISDYFVSRLESIFEGVAKNPLLLKNSTNTPLYLLCFAAGNKQGAKTAIRIAQDILGR